MMKKGDTFMMKKPGSGGTSFSSHALDYAVVLSEIRAIFEDMAQKASRDNRLASQYKQVELPLLFFIDSMISEHRLSFATKWNDKRLGYERKELAGGRKVFRPSYGNAK